MTRFLVLTRQRLSSFARLSVAGATAAISIVGAEPACAQTEMEVAGAASLVADTTIDFSGGGHRYFEYFAPDGTSRGGDGTGTPEIGKWYVRKDATVCFIHRDPNQSGCVFVKPLASSIEFHRIDGVVEGPFPHWRGNPKGL